MQGSLLFFIFFFIFLFSLIVFYFSSFIFFFIFFSSFLFFFLYIFILFFSLSSFCPLSCSSLDCFSQSCAFNWPWSLLHPSPLTPIDSISSSSTSINLPPASLVQHQQPSNQISSVPPLSTRLNTLTLLHLQNTITDPVHPGHRWPLDLCDHQLLLLSFHSVSLALCPHTSSLLLTLLFQTSKLKLFFTWCDLTRTPIFSSPSSPSHSLTCIPFSCLPPPCIVLKPSHCKVRCIVYRRGSIRFFNLLQGKKNSHIYAKHQL